MAYTYLVAHGDERLAARSRVRLTEEEVESVLQQFRSPLEFFFHRLHGGIDASHEVHADGTVEVKLETEQHGQDALDELMIEFLTALNTAAPGMGFALRERVS